MHAWQIAPTFPRPAPSPSDGAGLRCAGRLIEQIGEAAFAQTGLACLNEALQAASWSVYQVWPEQPRGAERPPVLHLSASHGVADTTGDCFNAYRDGLYRRDRSFDPVRNQTRPGHTMVMKMSADDAPNDDHREIIYRRHGVVERLSVAHWNDTDRSLLAVNLYHHSHQGRFDPLELERFSELAPLLLASVRRHIALRGRLQAGAPASADGVQAPTATVRNRLRERCPALTERELDVCERLLRGWSHDGIATDMGLGLATIKTYRARAFERLGLHFRSELFAAMAGR